jgi:integrase
MRCKAIERLVAVIGDKPILDVSVADKNKFNDWWSRHILINGLTSESARKDVDVIRKMIRSLCKRDGLRDPDVWGENPFPRSTGKRNAFSVAFLRDVMLAPHALDGMAPADRDLLHVLIDTGARISEIVSLRAPFIKLEHNIPHIRIREDGRQVKSKNAIRDLPLIGVALEAMRRNPDGWAQYRDNAKAASKELNKWIKKLLPDSAGITESDDDTIEGSCLYGLRHTFKDRLRAVRAEDEMKVALMGHDVGIVGRTPDYGNGFSLDAKLDTMRQLEDLLR